MDSDYEPEEGLNSAGVPHDHSLWELSIRETNSQTVAFQPIFDQLRQMHGGDDGAEVGGTDFGAMFFPYEGRPAYHEHNIRSVRYFGFLHDVVLVIAELLKNNDPGFGDMTLADIYQSPKLLLKLISVGRP